MESVTHTGIRPMTPAYAAPEQVRGESISAATDVYQFGILAYEVLTAHRPFEADAGSWFEMERAVLEKTPPRPSAAVVSEEPRTAACATEHIRPEAAGEARRLSGDRLRDQLRGDLDAIVMKALRKVPSRRYASAEAFVADIERYVEERPVEARSITPAYRLRKFIQRHQAGVAASAAFVVLVAGFVVTLLWQQRQMAEQRDRAQQEAQKAEEVSTFLMDLFEANDPSAAQGDTITARELLRRGLRRAEALEDQPAVRAQMLNVIGGIHRKQGRYPKAESLFSEALSLHRQMDARRIDIASSLSNLGHVLYLRGEDRDADSLLREALQIQQAELPAHRAERAEMLTRHGLALHDLGKYEQSEQRHREALRLFRAVHDSPHPDIAQVLNNLAMVLHDQDRLEEAERIYRKTLAMQNELLSAPHPDIAGTINNIGYVLRAQDEHARAEDRFRQVLRMDRALYGGTHPYLAYDHHNVARAMMQRGQHADAIPLLRQSASICREHLPDTRRLLISTHQRLGRSLITVDEYARAEASLQRALKLHRKEESRDAKSRRTLLNDFVRLYEAWGKPQQVADLRERLADMEGTAS
jgi:serine/threonine-protein kinase